MLRWCHVRFYRERWQSCLRSARGAATAEYALLLALIVIVLVGTLTTLGSVLNQKLQRIIDQLTQAGP